MVRLVETTDQLPLWPVCRGAGGSEYPTRRAAARALGRVSLNVVDYPATSVRAYDPWLTRYAYAASVEALVADGVEVTV